MRADSWYYQCIPGASDSGADGSGSTGGGGGGSGSGAGGGAGSGGTNGICVGTTRLALHADQALSQAQAAQFCKATHGPLAALPSAALVAGVQQLVQGAQVTFPGPSRARAASAQMHVRSVPTPPPSRASPPAQLTPAPPGTDGWSAGAWVDIARNGSSPTGWSSADGPASDTPWCPGEPNDRFSDEDCAVVLTFCTGGASAAVNDFNCGRTSRCALLGAASRALGLHS